MNPKKNECISHLYVAICNLNPFTKQNFSFKFFYMNKNLPLKSQYLAGVLFSMKKIAISVIYHCIYNFISFLLLLFALLFCTIGRSSDTDFQKLRTGYVLVHKISKDVFKTKFQTSTKYTVAGVKT